MCSFQRIGAVYQCSQEVRICCERCMKWILGGIGTILTPLTIWFLIQYLSQSVSISFIFLNYLRRDRQNDFVICMNRFSFHQVHIRLLSSVLLNPSFLSLQALIISHRRSLPSRYNSPTLSSVEAPRFKISSASAEQKSVYQNPKEWRSKLAEQNTKPTYY